MTTNDQKRINVRVGPTFLELFALMFIAFKWAGVNLSWLWLVVPVVAYGLSWLIIWLSGRLLIRSFGRRVDKTHEKLVKRRAEWTEMLDRLRREAAGIDFDTEQEN